MVWKKIRKRLRGDPPEPSWVDAADNPWAVRLLDVRPVTLNMLAMTQDEEVARNAISFGNDDGLSFIGEDPMEDRRIDADLSFKIDRALADGILFRPGEMEHKWAIFYHQGNIICVRSWLRKVWLVARVEEKDGRAVITSIRGTFTQAVEEEPSLTIRMMDFLLRSHVLHEEYPVPLPPGMDRDATEAGMWCMSMFGNLAWWATPHELERQEPERPLRTASMFHLAVARADVPAVESGLESGLPIDLFDVDGLTPLHYAVYRESTDMLDWLLERGASVDVQAEEGLTCLMIAAEDGLMDNATFLLDRGADPNAKDWRGYRSLHRAAHNGHLEMVKLLIDRGAEPNPKVDENTPLLFAQNQGHESVVEFLRELV